MRARAWLRVSTDEQDENQQLIAVRRRIAYGDQGTAWTFDEARDIYRAHGVSGDDTAHPRRQAVFADARAGAFDVLVVWALDRWTRAGIEQLLSDVKTFKKAGVRLVSVQEDWADNELLTAVAAWVARQELLRRRERAKMAIERVRATLASNGKFITKKGHVRTSIGRPKKVTPELRAAVLALRAETPSALSRRFKLARATVRAILAG